MSSVYVQVLFQILLAAVISAVAIFLFHCLINRAAEILAQLITGKRK